MKDFIVNITKLTKAITQQGFGLPLILATTKAHPYTLYNDISELAEDFTAETATYKIASRIFGQNPAPAQIAVYGVLYDAVEGEAADLVTALNTLVETNNDWYFLVCDRNDADIITALSGWVDTQIKMYFVTSQTLTTPVALESERTVVMYHDDEDAYVAEGLASYLATAPVGGVTAKFKTIEGVGSANITATELNRLHENGGFSYVRKMGVLQTTEGSTTNGSYIDLTMGSFFIKFRIEEEVMLMAVNNEKIPYSNTGIAMLVGAVDSVLKKATNQGIILEEDGKGVYEISYIPREDMPKNKIANREYDGIRATATIAGAIHDGTITVDLVL